MLRTFNAWVKNRMSDLLRVPLRLAIRLVKSNKTLSSLAYDVANNEAFGRLYEHEKMLADRVRVDTYAAGIRKLVKQGDVVLDLGTGSGILAILAARQGAKVCAIDHSDFIFAAEENARRNNVSGITFVQTNSRDFNHEEKFDVLLHEQIGDSIFDENMVENLLDLKRRLLANGGKIVPGRFNLYMEPVSLHPEFRIPFIDEIVVQGVDFKHLAETTPASPTARYYKHPIEPAAIAFFLADPTPILTVDLNEIDDATAIPSVVHASRKVVRPGRMDGIYQYFSVIFDDQVWFDTSPFSIRTHWVNRLFRMPHRDYAVGETINYVLDMNDIRRANAWSVSLTAQAAPSPAASVAPAGAGKIIGAD